MQTSTVSIEALITDENIKMCKATTMGKVITKYRKQTRYSKTGLAQLIGLGYLSIHRWEIGLNKPRVNMIRKMEEVLDLKPNTIYLETLLNDGIITQTQIDMLPEEERAGKNKPESTTSDIVQKYNKLTQEHQIMIMSIVEGLLPKETQNA